MTTESSPPAASPGGRSVTAATPPGRPASADEGPAPRVGAFSHLGLIALLLVPAVMVVGIFAGLHTALRESLTEDAREALRVASARMTTAAHPREILRAAHSRTSSAFSYVWANATTVAALARWVDEFVAASGTTHIFGPCGKMLWPADGVPDRAEREIMWQGFRNYRLGVPMDVVKRRIDVAARRVLLTKYGEANYLNVSSTKLFLWELRGRTTPTWVAALQLGLPGHPEHASMIWIEIDPTTLGVPRVASAALAAMPEGAAGAAAVVQLGRGPVAVRGVFAGDPLALATRLPPGEIEVARNGVTLTAPVPMTASMVLVLERTLPWPLTLPPWAHYGLIALFLTGACGLSRHLALAIVGARRVRASIGVQLFAAFLVSASVPLLSLVYLGAVRLINFERAEQGRWLERSADQGASIDRGFRDTVETRQSSARALARFLSAAPDLPRALARNVPPDLDDPEVMCFIASQSKSYVPRSPGRREVAQDGPPSASILDRVGDFVGQIVEQLRAEHDEAMGVTAGKTPKPGLTLVDLLGEHNTILAMLRSFGRNSLFSLQGGQQFLSLNSLILGVDGRPRAHLVVLFDTLRMSNAYVRGQAAETERLLRTTAINDLPDAPLVVTLSQGGGFHPDGLYTADIEAAMLRTQETGLDEYLVTAASGSRWLVATVPVHHLVGVRLAMAVPMGKIEAGALDLRRRLMWLLLAGLMLVGVGSMTLRSLLLLPIALLEEGARDVAGGVYTRRVEVLARDELGALSAAFNDMSAGLQERDRLRRFISTAAFEAIRTGADGERGARRQGVALLAADLRGFTSLSEAAAPEQVVAALNDYFSLMDRVIADHGGVVMKLVGDAILAMFRVRMGLEHPARRAALAGLAMRRALGDLNARSAAGGGLIFENGVGVHWGRVVLGRVGSRHGRVDYSLLGAPVTEVQALESASKMGRHSRVVVSTAAHAWCGDDLAATPLTGRETTAVELLGEVAQ